MLDKLKVLDFGWVWAGALPGQLLSFLGAEVIKVESSKRLDFMRLGPPIVGDKPDPNQQPMFHSINRGKLSLCIDLQKSQARELILNLAEHCGVVVENFSPGVIGKLGFDYATLVKRRPDLVMLSLSGGGQTGALSHLRSYASTISAFIGLDALCGYQGEPPLGIQQSYPDPHASICGALGVMAALYRREVTGKGDFIDLAQMDAGLTTVGEAMAALDLFGGLQMPLACDERNTGSVLKRTVRCLGEDNWVLMEARTQEEWKSLTRLVGYSGDSVEGVMGPFEKWCLGRDHLQAMCELQDAGVPAGAVTTVADRFNDQHFRARKAYFETIHPVIGKEVVYGDPVHWLKGGGDVEVRRAPLLGEANHYVVCDILGYSDDEYQRLTAEGVLC
jgi:benzylsuccinate CoA-transferase BbsF subunit